MYTCTVVDVNKIHFLFKFNTDEIKKPCTHTSSLTAGSCVLRLLIDNASIRSHCATSVIQWRSTAPFYHRSLCIISVSLAVHCASLMHSADDVVQSVPRTTKCWQSSIEDACSRHKVDSQKSVVVIRTCGQNVTTPFILCWVIQDLYREHPC